LATKDQSSSGKRSYTTVGVAWSIFDGEGLTIKLNPGTVKAEAHHDDYSKPFEVRWLCRMHHRAVHGQKADPF
jgi:hypothetical protein